ncbi:M48 family metallopeptidase [Glycomyces sp. MUSA5-2]|uniref:M48 family metallopeptidase n=1 Tax=Glycomyces sp. MUSA5-2 TaxID=2053002 RepID=UPI00300B3C00
MSPWGGAKIAVALLPLLAALGYGLWALAAADREPPDGVLVEERDQPRLWALVRVLAAAVGTGAPHEIRLTADANAAVREDRRGCRTHRTMSVGAPLLAAMTATQLAAVLAHELAHYAGRDTRFAGAAYRSRRTYVRTLAALNGDDLLQRALRAVLDRYGAFVLRASAGLARAQEQAADRAAALAAGSAATAGALALLDPSGPAAADPYDTHPPTARRIAAVAAMRAPGSVPVPAGAAAGLLRDPERLFGAVAGPPANTDAVLANAARATGREPTLPVLLDALDAGLLPDLAPASPGDPPRVRRERARLYVRDGLHRAAAAALTGADAHAALPAALDAAVADAPDTAPLRALLTLTTGKANTSWHCS